jgi:hypothetical protein
MEHANRFLVLEAELWALAKRYGGLSDAVPYPVRYEAGRYLWEPAIRGAAFCLRCGDTIRYRRSARPGTRWAPACGRCVRSGSLRWPAHAVMPDGRGAWWLWCRAPGCTNVFVGAGQARRCPRHRLNRLGRSKREVSRSSIEETHPVG